MGHIAKWREFSREEIEKIVKESYSDREVARRLGYAQNGGGTMKSLHGMYQELNLDTSHFKGQGWNKGNYDYESFKSNNYKKRGDKILKPLIALKGRQCENCGLTEWLGEPITLEVHHIDGDHYNNSMENLQLLCPNCHSYTENWRGKGIKKKPEIPEEEFVKVLQNNKNIRQALLELGLTGAGGNYERANELIVKYQIAHLQKTSTQEGNS